MEPLLDSASLLLAGAGVLVLIAGPRVGWKPAVAFTMDLWTASGLLKLAGMPSWQLISSSAAIIVARHIILAQPIA